ncbi:hypothetical protein ACVWYH_005782 [Bradyrhizobium sp. GM24.11]
MTRWEQARCSVSAWRLMARPLTIPHSCSSKKKARRGVTALPFTRCLRSHEANSNTFPTLGAGSDCCLTVSR